MLEEHQTSRVKKDRKVLDRKLLDRKWTENCSHLDQGKLDGVREADPLLQSKYGRAWELGNN